MALAIGVHKHTHGFCHTDSIRQLHEHFVGYSSCHHVLGDVASSISRRAVYLRGVFSRESTTTMSTFTAISVNDNLTSRKPRIAMRTTNHELTCRIHVISNFALFKECLHFGSRHSLFEHTRNKNLNHILADFRQHLFVCSSLTTSFFGRDEIIVLRAHHNSIDAHCTVVIVIFHRHLTLRVGTEIGHHLAFATDVSQHNENVVCQR